MVLWQKIPIEPKQLLLSTVLRCGQTFRWRCVDEVWSICMAERVILLKQDSQNVYFTSITSDEQYKKLQPYKSTEEVLVDYFNLHIDVSTLYKDWTERDSKFAAKQLSGIRILRQDPWETLCAFICSSNNNIKRISKMVNSLCTEFGPYIASHDGQSYHGFPKPEALANDGVEQRLRELGFGYRAKYIVQTAMKVADMPNGVGYLDSLRHESLSDAHEKLLDFSGVGPKVADCVCLMSLDKHDVVPVDTHIWQIASRDYKMKVKNMSAKNYKMIQDNFRRIWGDYAGWAHSVLFTADLSDLNNGINVKKESSPVSESIEKLAKESESRPKIRV